MNIYKYLTYHVASRRCLPPFMNKSWARHRESKGYPENDHDGRSNRSGKRKGTKRPAMKCIPRVFMQRDLSSRSAKSYAPTRACRVSGRFVRDEKGKIARLIHGNNGLIDLDERNHRIERTSRRWRADGRNRAWNVSNSQIKASYSDVLTRSCYATRVTTAFKQIVQHLCQTGHLLRVTRTPSFLRFCF